MRRTVNSISGETETVKTGFSQTTTIVASLMMILLILGGFQLPTKEKGDGERNNK